MFKQYRLECYFGDDLIFRKDFKSINNAIKICCGFDSDIAFEITNLITDKVFCDFEVSDMVSQFISDNDCEV